MTKYDEYVAESADYELVEEEVEAVYQSLDLSQIDKSVTEIAYFDQEGTLLYLVHLGGRV